MPANATAARANRSSVKLDPTNERATIRRYGLIVSALLLIGVALVFGQVRHFDFAVIDDGEYVTDNAQIKSGLSWATVKWSFTHAVAANWHPLAMLSHALDCQVFGQNAGAHHMVNVVFHAADTVLLFWLLVILLRSAGSDRDPLTHVWMCGIVAALFGLHPLRAESVAWVSERKDVLSAFFFMLTLLAYLRYVRSRIEKFNAAAAYIITLILFTLGLLAKPMLVTLPFVLLLLDFWPLNRLPIFRAAGALIFEKVPMFLLSGAVSVTTFLVQKHSGSVVALQSFSMSERLQNVVVSYARYLGKTFWPVNLCAYYPYTEWAAWQVAGSALLFIALSALAFLNLRKRPFLFVGWFWFVGMLVPVIGFAQVGGQSMADRYAYLPHVGLFIAVVWGSFELARKPALIGLTVAAVACAVIAVSQVAYWRDSEALFDHTLRLTGDNNISAQYFMALALESKGKKAEAVSHFREAIRGNPDNIKAITHLGRILGEQGKFDEARQQFEAALRVDSDLPLTQINLADMLMRLGRRDEAIDHYIAGMQSQPNMPEAHFELSALLSAKHDYEGAIAHLRTAIAQKPNYTDALNSLAWMLATQPNPKLRNGADAVQFAEQAVALTKNSDAGMLDTLAAAYAEAGRFPEAVKTAEMAVRIASASGDPKLSIEIGSRLKLYQSGTAYRE